MLNWAGNLTYSATDLRRPATLDELATALEGSGPVRALGSRHSFNDVADTTGVHVQVDRLDDGRPAVDLDPATGVVSVNAGLRYGEVSRALHPQGRALGNLASLPHISVAGAVATATHGSGDANRCLAGDVVGLEVMTTAGELRRVTRAEHPDVFGGTVVSLGALGVVTRVELATSPTFAVRQDVAVDVPWETVLGSFDTLTGAAYSVSLFTSWAERSVRQVWFKSRVDDGVGERPEPLPGLGWATTELHPLPGVDPVACTPQLGVAGPWHERLSHFRLEFTPSAGDELQSEYLLPRRHAVEAIVALRRLAPRVAPLLQTSEVRTVAADDLWLSPFDEDSVALHFTWHPRGEDVAAVLPLLEEALLPLGARPHWGKLFALDPVALRELYPRFEDFRALAARFDPDGRLHGGYLRELLG
ncbi:xylitol oxidase [Isoptericola jiangsuensis]|uniref:Xylitol oxidase n=1 Tax=Isoptericola jiangsuensis TaxID=548579 RepID=A0A2A9F112_9MICO|nr:D-arabinono-1,4-lactone oxidase [Isoptericola jiangsuensis]PFG44838.1 xylitol oxidase [Isoptericola jiangsuensis]